MDRIIRILTAGKPLDLIDQEIAQAIQSGNRVLVKAGNLTANFPEANSLEANSLEPDPLGISQPQRLDSENSVVAKWAEDLSHAHGLVWLRVGLDMLFTKAPAESIRRKN